MKLVLALLSVASVAALAPQQGLNRRAVLKTGAAFPAFLVGAGKARAADKKAAAPAKAAPLAAPEAGFAQSPTGLQSKELSRPDGMERLATNVLKVGRGRGWGGAGWWQMAAAAWELPNAFAARTPLSRQHARPGAACPPSADQSKPARTPALPHDLASCPRRPPMLRPASRPCHATTCRHDHHDHQ